MTKETLLFKSKERKTREEVAEFLHLLADKISGGNLTMKQGQEEINLDFPPNLTLDVVVEDKEKQKKGTQHKLEVEIKWYDNEDSGPLELG